MNNLNLITGIVIKKTPYNEYNEILTILTKEGKKTLFAPGVRKIESKNRFSINLLDYSEFEIFNLKKASLIIQFPFEINELSFRDELLFFVNKLPLTNASNFINSYSKLSKLLNQNMDNKIFTYFLYMLLKDEGINPKMDGCVECGNKNHLIDFKFHKGGFLCDNHSNDILGKEKLIALYNLSISFEQFSANTSFAIALDLKRTIIEYISELYI